MDNAALVVKLKNALLDNYNPEAVILFDSLARGDADEFSDVDLLVPIEREADQIGTNSGKVLTNSE